VRLPQARAASCHHRIASRRAALRQARTRSVGLEGPQDSLAVASSAPAHHAAGVSRGHLGTRPGARAPRLRRLQSTRPPRVLVSAAGPGGAWLSRSWSTTGPGGWGVAPALLPTQPGERGKPHWRDAIQLARRRRSGALPPVHGPAVAAAARRDRGRARAAASGALQTAQWRRPAWRLRPASRSTGRAPWGPASRRAVPDHPARRVRLAPARPAQGPPSAPSPVSPPYKCRVFFMLRWAAVVVLRPARLA
jgi:hypothetical protein